MKVMDLRIFLDNWPYNAENNVRISHGEDGREIILVRQPMGLEQYEIDGRPDGRRVHGMESLFAFHHARINAAKQIHSAIGFDLSAEDCAQLFHEAVSYYQRLIVLFRLKDWTRVVRDARHSLCLIEFIKQHAQCEEDRELLDEWRPDITRINAVARAMVLLEKSHYQEALRLACGTVGLSGAVANDGPDRRKLAKALIESVEESLANRPSLPTHEESVFLQHNDYWMIHYRGRTAFLKSIRGLCCLAVLLRHPGREFHVSELLASLTEAPIPASAFTARGRRRAMGGELVAAGFSDAGPLLDAKAKAQCKLRLNDLRQDLSEAEKCNDVDRQVKAREELHAIMRHLASAVGLGGRDRKAASDVERARSTVTKRVKKAVRKIGEAIPSLGHHLTARIKTGYFFSYSPHPDRPVAWKFRA